MTIRVLVPVLNRPHNVAPLLKSLTDSDPGVPVDVTFIVSPNDIPEQRMLQKHAADYLRAPFSPGRGDWARKINLAVTLYDDDWFLLGADDIRFHPGWAKAALECAESGALVVGTNDLGNPHARQLRSFSTHPLVHRSYIQRGVIDQPGVLLNENYDHNFPDRELAETAKHHGVWAYCDHAVIEHMHPAWGKGETDDVYRKGLKNFHRDQVMFLRRRVLWRGTGRGRARHPRRVLP